MFRFAVWGSALALEGARRRPRGLSGIVCGLRIRPGRRLLLRRGRAHRLLLLLLHGLGLLHRLRLGLRLGGHTLRLRRLLRRFLAALRAGLRTLSAGLPFGRGRGLRVGRRLIALHQFRRHALGHARHPAGKHRPAVARKLLLRIEEVEAVGELLRIESRGAGCKRQRHRDCDQNCARATNHRVVSSQPLLPSTVSARKASMRRRRLCGASSSPAIASSQRLTPAVSLARYADSASSSRAVWRNEPFGSVSASSLRVISVYAAVSTSMIAARIAATSRNGCATDESAATASNTATAPGVSRLPSSAAS